MSDQKISDAERRMMVIDAFVTHRIRKSYWDIWACSCDEWRLSDGVYGDSPTLNTLRQHATHVALKAGLR